MSSILEQYREQRQRLATAYIMPTRITFSQAGYTKMMSEHDSSALMLNTVTPAGQPKTYDGFPFTVVSEQAEEIKLHNSMTDPGRQRAITFAMKGSFGKLGSEEPKTMVEVVAQSLDAATLCDIIMHWLGQDPHWGDFEKALHKVVEEHGTFE